ncbi:MAG: DUF1810 domain-containing protein [Bacteroidales bacterium]|nr:DUF1810 domain-containing protein [Bacteroidales bacterium]
MKELPETDINRFVEAQNTPYLSSYRQALEEVKNGRKKNHWIWFIFPCFRCFAHSPRSHYYGIRDLNEAMEYLNHPILGNRLREITTALLKHEDKTAMEIFGPIDIHKVRSSMTMFDAISPNDIFKEVIDRFFQGTHCEKTQKVLRKR